MSRMGMSFDLSQRQSQQQVIAPKMLKSMEYLQLPLMALQERVTEALEENPFLEVKESRAKETSEDTFNADAPLKHDEKGESEFARMDEINRDWGDHFNEDHRPSRAGIDDLGDKKLEAMMNIADNPVSLQEHLSEQLACQALPPQTKALCEYVISHLDDNGYLLAHDPESGRPLTIPLDELARNYSEPVTMEQVEEALFVIQELDPPGVGARDTKECLLIQVSEEEMEHADLVRELIQHHLEDVAHNRLAMIQKRVGCSVEMIREAIQELRQLNPKPGAKFANESAKYIVPDIKITRNDAGDYDIKLTNDWTPNVRVSSKYEPLVKDKNQDPKTREYLGRKLLSANWIVDAIRQRRETLTKVTRAIIDRQRQFLDRGPDFILPLKMDDIAKIVGVHVTTISRAVDDKYIETPRGVFPLKRFFGGGVQNTETGENVAWESIKTKLLEMIAEENKAKPLSDEDIEKKFDAMGLKVARRTVTKYREALKIPSSRQRKEVK
ncbi:MAG: RNA polymerase factor sigma-54 [Fimbriiglobus sp.]